MRMAAKSRPALATVAAHMTRIFSGIQPTGQKHLGNYIGAIRHYVTDQDLGEAFYCVVDLHSISVAYDRDTLAENTLDTAATLLAAGLEPDRCTLFVQSHVPAHSEGAWLLGSVASFGELSRMTQFKDKSEGRESVSVDLFTYPVLQAADILLYDTDRVPVGDDQRQHVELMRNVAERFNSRFGETLVAPEVRVPAVGARIMDLQAPERKMSTTSGSVQGTIYVTDEPDDIRRKFKRAVADSGSEVRRAPDKPGISNLIDILAAVRGIEPAAVEAEFAGSGYGAFKGAVAEAVVEYLTPVRGRYAELREDEDELERILAAGADKAREIASDTLSDVRTAMGIGPIRARV